MRRSDIKKMHTGSTRRFRRALKGFFVLYLLVFLMVSLSDVFFQPHNFHEALFFTTSIVTLSSVALQEFMPMLEDSGILILLCIHCICWLFWVSISVWILYSGSTLHQYTYRSILSKSGIMLLISILLSASMIFYVWGDVQGFNGILQKVLYAVFNAASAFTNAGVLVVPAGTPDFWLAGNFVLQGVLLTTAIAGASGYFVLNDLFNPTHLRARLRDPSLDWKLYTRIAVFGGGSLILIGAGCFLYFEFSNSLQGLKAMEKVVSSVFLAAMSRNTGMNLFDLNQVGLGGMLVLITAMMAGGMYASGSGGLKLEIFLFPFIKREKNLIRQMIKVLVFILFFNYLSIVIRIASGDASRLVIMLFEQISAFTNTGWKLHALREYSAQTIWTLNVSMLGGRLIMIWFVSKWIGKTSLFSSRTKHGRLV
jgi:Trk-type K+ transport system membrane component